MESSGPLQGLRILELGHYIAAPFCTRLLADLGADVIKVEPRSGDPIRQWGAQLNGTSPWWSVHGRTKRCMTLDLKSPRGRDLILQIAAKCDAVIENFRPGHLAKLNLDAASFEAARPGIVLAHISGYGQDGPGRDRAAFGVIGEAIGGLRYLTNHAPGVSSLPPVRVGISIGDSIAGLYTAFGVMSALWRRDASVGGDGKGRAVDVALSEAVFSMLEGILPEYGLLGKIREPAGSAIPTAAPSDAYPSADGKWVLIAANSDPLFRRLTELIGQPALAVDPRFIGNQQRCSNRRALDEAIGAWTMNHDAACIERMLEDADIPATRAYTIADCAADPQFLARGMVREVADPALGMVLHPGIVPAVPDDPGCVRWPGPPIGAHNEDVFGHLLGLSAGELAQLQADGIC